ncbi:MAG: TldD/PmbA family protein [Thiotrichales bacterium]
MNLDLIVDRIRLRAPAVTDWSARIVATTGEHLRVRQGVPLPPTLERDLGVFITVIDSDGMGYAATSNVTAAGIDAAFATARRWADASRGRLAIDPREVPRATAQGRYAASVALPWESESLAVKLEWLAAACGALHISDEIVDWEASLGHEQRETWFLSSAGADVRQRFDYLFPGYEAVASRGSLTQIRSGGGAGSGRQGGLELLAEFGFPDTACSAAEEALQLLNAPECPSAQLDLLLMPGQMVLQIHESIGHPLELDRILGDERNYAGTSFVKPEMFGHYRYGSEHLNVTFAPQMSSELVSYAFDDEGSRAETVHLIRNGILERPLGGALSQSRSGLAGTANARACNWNRPAIDRMANLNIEPGAHTLNDLIGQIEYGVMMESNRSWSIDDSRNKFQFGCEIGWLIRDGERREVVRNPNYRGVSANFWRNLAAVGDRSTWRVSGVTNCGKGEPNQSVYVGHATPACLFRSVEVFGGET